MAIAELRAIGTLDGKPFELEITKMGNSVQKLGSKQFAGLKGMIAGAFSVGAVIGFTKSIMNTAAEIQHASESFNISTDSLQALKAQALESNVAFDEITASLNRITKTQAEALTGNVSLQKAFGVFNISMQDLARMSPDEIMQRIGAGLKEGGRSAGETAATFDILGRSSGRLLGFLETLGSQGLDVTIQKFKELGMVMDEMAIKQMDAAQDALERFGIQSRTVAGEVLLGWRIIWDTLAGMSTGLSFKEAYMATARGLGMLGGGKGKPGMGIEGDLKRSAEESRWFNLKEASLLRQASIVSQIAYYEDEIAKLRKAQALSPADLGIATDILEREKKVADLFEKQDAAKEKLVDLYEKQDELALSYEKKQADIMAGKGIATPEMARVGALQRIGGIIGGVAGGDQAARREARQEKIQEALKKAAEDTRRELEKMNATLDTLIE